MTETDDSIIYLLWLLQTEVRIFRKGLGDTQLLLTNIRRASLNIMFALSDIQRNMGEL